MTIHDEFQDNQFDEARDFAARASTTKTLIIASSERSGSHLLGQVLRATGQFGDPLEYMHGRHIERWKEILGVASAHEALRVLQTRRTSPNGVFSIKLHYSHLRALGGLPAVRKIFPDPHIVLLRRRNALKQAVSHVMASQSGLWIGDVADPAAVRYDRSKVERALAHAIREHANWRFDVMLSGLPVLDVDHEDVVADFPSAVRRLARYLGIELSDSDVPPAPVTRQQSSPINEQWLARFLAETPDDAPSGLPDNLPLKRRVIETIRSKIRRGRG